MVTRDPHAEGRPSTWALPDGPDEYVSAADDTYSVTRTRQAADQGTRSDEPSTCHTRGHDTYSDPAADHDDETTAVGRLLDAFPGTEVVT